MNSYFCKVFRAILLYPLLALLFVNTTTSWSQDIGKMIDKAELQYDQSPAQSFSIYEAAEREAELTSNHAFDGEIALGQGRYNLLVAKYDASSAKISEAILFFEAKNDKRGLAKAFSLKSILFERIGATDASHAMLLKTLEIDIELDDSRCLLADYANLSLDYYRSEKADSMKYCLEQMEKHRDDLGEYEDYYYFQNWGMYFQLIQDYNRALQQYDTAQKIAEKKKMTDSRATILMLKAQTYRLKKDLKKAELAAQESYTFSEENNLIYESSEALQELIKIKKDQKDFKGAIAFQEKWIKVDNEINDIERMQRVNAIEAQLEIAENEKTIALGEAELQAEKLEGEKVRTKNAWLVGVVILIIVLLVFTAFIYVRTRKLNRTISRQKEEVELKSLKLEDALTSIQDSLEYSKLIQSSMLPPLSLLDNNFKEKFVYYNPKDIVSGDFYWIHQTDGLTIFAVGDCTGHGVPGAMVSMVCHEALNKVVKEKGITEPALILDEVRGIVADTFSQNTANLNDGMDVAVCKIEGDKLTFAGAQNPVWIVRDEKTEIHPDFKTEVIAGKNLISLKGDKQPIGRYLESKPFTSKHIQLLENDLIYLFSDGYVDQFGGEKGKKFKASNFKELVVNLANRNLSEHKEALNKTFEDWKGSLEQVDDVCIMGLRF
jgi:serine phosphatase RsbU (regulator of sigma subunit)